MEERFGNFDLGKDADFLLIEPDRWEPLASVLERGIRADDAEMATDQTLFALLLALRQPAITGVFVRGRRVQAPEPEHRSPVSARLTGRPERA